MKDEKQNGQPPTRPRSDALRGNASATAPRWCLFGRARLPPSRLRDWRLGGSLALPKTDAERPKTRSHALRGNEGQEGQLGIHPSSFIAHPSGHQSRTPGRSEPRRMSFICCRFFWSCTSFCFRISRALSRLSDWGLSSSLSTGRLALFPAVFASVPVGLPLGIGPVLGCGIIFWGPGPAFGSPSSCPLAWSSVPPDFEAGGGSGCSGSGGVFGVCGFAAFLFASAQSNFASSRLCRASALSGSSAGSSSRHFSKSMIADRYTPGDPPVRSRQVPRLNNALPPRSGRPASADGPSLKPPVQR